MGKPRVVFDCLATAHGKSLNTQVHHGINNKLIGVLLRFRLEPVAITAEIQSMFHCVSVKEEDQDVLRFLWWEDGDTTKPAEIYRLTVHLFGGTWSPSCCTTALQRVANDFGDDYSELTNYSVLNSFYVDDLVCSTKDTETAIQLAHELRELLSKGGFNLTKWLCNEPSVNRSIPISHQSKSLQDILLGSSLTERALGIHWNVNEDVISYKMKMSNKPVTKRGA